MTIEGRRLLSFFKLPQIAVVYTAITLTSVLLLGSTVAVIPAAAIILFAAMGPTELILAIFLVSCMVNIPMLHIPPSESLSLRVNDLLIIGIVVRLMIKVAIGRPLTLVPVPKRYRRRFAFVGLTLAVSFVIALSGGFGSYSTDKAFLANLLWAGGREVAFILVFFLFAWNAYQGDVRRAYVRTLYLSIAVASAYVALEFFGLAPVLWEQLPGPWKTVSAEVFGAQDFVGSFNRNHSQIGIVTSLGLLLGLAAFSDPKIRLRPSLIVLSQGVILLALVVSRKRAAYLACAIGVAVYLILSFGDRERIRAVAAVVTLGLLVTVGSVVTGIGATVREEVEGLIGTESLYGATSGRIVQWMGSANYLMTNPTRIPLGSGLTYDSQIGSATSIMEKRGGSHNQWLGLIVERGIVGFAAMLLLLTSFIRDAWEARHPLQKASLQSEYRLAYVAFLAGAAVFSMASYVFVGREPIGTFPALFMMTSAIILTDLFHSSEMLNVREANGAREPAGALADPPCPKRHQPPPSG